VFKPLVISLTSGGEDSRMRTSFYTLGVVETKTFWSRFGVIIGV